MSAKGHKWNEEQRQRYKGAGNPFWAGDKVTYAALHSWVRRYKPKSTLCEACNVAPPYDLANISQQYKRDLDDWEWLCRRCHMAKDGRLKIFPYTNKAKGEKQAKAKLNQFQVQRIRLMKEITPNLPCIKIAQLFNVSFSAIQSILSRRTWKHIP